MKKIKGYNLVKKDSEYYISEFPPFPNKSKKSKYFFQSLERTILKERFIWYPLKFNIIERIVYLSEENKESFSFSGIIKLIDGDKKLFINTDTFFKIKISFPDNKAELKIIYYTIDNIKGMIECSSSDMLLDIIFINYKTSQFTPKRVESLINDYNLDMKEIRQLPIIPVQWLNFDENNNLLEFPNIKL